MIFERSAQFHHAANGRLRSGIKDQRHAVAGGDFDQTLCRLSFLKLLGRTDDLRQLINSSALLINRKLLVANDVDEQDMGDFELDLFLDLSGHLVGRLFPVLHAMGFWSFYSPHGNGKMI